MRPFREMLGEVVLKHFEGHGTFMGTIIEYDDQTGFRLQFDDGDTEDVSLQDLCDLLPPTHPEATRASAGRPTVSTNARSLKSPKLEGRPTVRVSAPVKTDPASVAPPPRKKMLLERSTAEDAREAQHKLARKEEGHRSPAPPTAAAPSSATSSESLATSTVPPAAKSNPMSEQDELRR